MIGEYIMINRDFEDLLYTEGDQLYVWFSNLLIPNNKDYRDIGYILSDSDLTNDNLIKKMNNSGFITDGPVEFLNHEQSIDDVEYYRAYYEIGLREISDPKYRGVRVFQDMKIMFPPDVKGISSI